MRPQVRVMLIALIVLVAVVAAIVWNTRSTAPVPEYQNRVAIPGRDPHPVSLWIDPSPPTTGPVELTVQVAEPNGNPIGADDVTLYVFPTGGFPADGEAATYVTNAPIQDFLGTGHGYRALVEIPDPGDWHVEVEFTLAGNTRTTTFDIEVGS